MKRFLIFLGIVFLLNLYVYSGYKVLLQNMEGRLNTTLKVVYWVIVAAAYLAFLYASSNFRSGAMAFWPKAALSFFSIFIVIQLTWGVFLVIDDVVRVGQWVSGLFQSSESLAENGGISRKSFITKTGALVATGFGTALTYGVVRGSHKYRVINQKLHIDGLPEELKGTRILQISDVHSGSFWNKDSVQQGVDMIKDQKADIVFFTGDIVNNQASEMDEYIDVFSQIKAPHGVFSILGNHDYGEYLPGFKKEDLPENVNAIAQVHKKLGWDLLLNEHRVLNVAGKELAIVGVENWGNKMHFSQYGDLPKAVEGLDEKLPTLLLSHDPSHWRGQVLTEFPQVDVTFSGHTHGMQFGVETAGFKWSPIKYMYPEWAGLYEKGHQKLYVNRGFGYLGFPGRFGIWPEITVFELA